MAAKKEVPADNTDRVSVSIPRGAKNDDPNFFVSVNGPDTIIPRGTTAKVPQHVRYEIERSRAAQDALDKRMDEMIEKGRNLA